MAQEIEYKYLVINQLYRELATSRRELVQGYLSRRAEAVVRVRVDGPRAWLTVKSANRGAARGEWEYEVPVTDAREMLALAEGEPLSKTRWLVPFGGHIWEVDEFHGRHEGLVVAEVEVAAEGERPELPPFVGREVTGDPAYYNSNLA